MSRKTMNVGDNFGDWTVIDPYPIKGKPVATCKCKCGIIKSVQRAHLSSGASERCRECGYIISGLKGRLPNRRTNAYTIWTAIVSRCNGLDLKHPRYKGLPYVGFDVFFDEVGERPSKEYSIDRIDNTKGYILGNMRWATVKTQANNKSDTIYHYDINGIKYPLTEICETYNLIYNTARAPHRRNMTVEELVSDVRYVKGKRGFNL